MTVCGQKRAIWWNLRRNVQVHWCRLL